MKVCSLLLLLLVVGATFALSAAHERRHGHGKKIKAAAHGHSQVNQAHGHAGHSKQAQAERAVNTHSVEERHRERKIHHHHHHNNKNNKHRHKAAKAVKLMKPPPATVQVDQRVHEEDFGTIGSDGGEASGAGGVANAAPPAAGPAVALDAAQSGSDGLWNADVARHGPCLRDFATLVDKGQCVQDKLGDVEYFLMAMGREEHTLSAGYKTGMARAGIVIEGLGMNATSSQTTPLSRHAVQRARTQLAYECAPSGSECKSYMTLVSDIDSKVGKDKECPNKLMGAGISEHTEAMRGRMKEIMHAYSTNPDNYFWSDSRAYASAVAVCYHVRAYGKGGEAPGPGMLLKQNMYAPPSSGNLEEKTRNFEEANVASIAYGDNPHAAAWMMQQSQQRQTSAERRGERPKSAPARVGTKNIQRLQGDGGIEADPWRGVEDKDDERGVPISRAFNGLGGKQGREFDTANSMTAGLDALPEESEDLTTVRESLLFAVKGFFMKLCTYAKSAEAANSGKTVAAKDRVCPPAARDRIEKFVTEYDQRLEFGEVNDYCIEGKGKVECGPGDVAGQTCFPPPSDIQLKYIQKWITGRSDAGGDSFDHTSFLMGPFLDWTTNGGKPEMIEFSPDMDKEAWKPTPTSELENTAGGGNRMTQLFWSTFKWPEDNGDRFGAMQIAQRMQKHMGPHTIHKRVPFTVEQTRSGGQTNKLISELFWVMKCGTPEQKCQIYEIGDGAAADADAEYGFERLKAQLPSIPRETCQGNPNPLVEVEKKAAETQLDQFQKEWDPGHTFLAMIPLLSFVGTKFWWDCVSLSFAMMGIHGYLVAATKKHQPAEKTWTNIELPMLKAMGVKPACPGLWTGMIDGAEAFLNELPAEYRGKWVSAGASGGLTTGDNLASELKDVDPHFKQQRDEECFHAEV